MDAFRLLAHGRVSEDLEALALALADLLKPAEKPAEKPKSKKAE